MNGNLDEQTVLFQQTNDADQLTHQEIWDDSLLIQQYDESMNQARCLLANKINSATESECSQEPSQEHMNGYFHAPHHRHCKTKKKKKTKKKNEWHIGDPCLARYQLDGELYEATIVDVTQGAGICTVRYLGYNNHESVAMSSLLKSRGEAARHKQQMSIEGVTSQYDDSTDESSVIESEAASDSGKESFNRGNSRRRSPCMMPPPPVPQGGDFQSMPFLPTLPPPPPALGLVDGSDAVTTQALHTMLLSWYMTGYNTGYYEGLKHGKINALSKRTKKPTKK